MLTIEDIQLKLTPIFQEYNVSEAVLFGSYAKGNATEASDIDLLIDIDESIGGFGFMDLQYKMEKAVQKEVELFAKFELIPNARIDQEIKATGRVIYEHIY